MISNILHLALVYLAMYGGWKMIAPDVASGPQQCELKVWTATEGFNIRKTASGEWVEEPYRLPKSEWKKKYDCDCDYTEGGQPICLVVRR